MTAETSSPAGVDLGQPLDPEALDVAAEVLAGCETWAGLAEHARRPYRDRVRRIVLVYLASAGGTAKRKEPAGA